MITLVWEEYEAADSTAARFGDFNLRRAAGERVCPISGLTLRRAIRIIEKP